MLLAVQLVATPACSGFIQLSSRHSGRVGGAAKTQEPQTDSFLDVVVQRGGARRAYQSFILGYSQVHFVAT